jgi:glycosyltransferase involved in cell wall biosynthesis
MKLSIVTISFNQAQFLAAALESVLRQDYPGIEYIVVDAGSTDGSREILEKYRPRLARLMLEPDRGPADGLNKGFRHASGDVFAYLNSDDVLLPGAVGEAMAFLRRNPQVDVLAGHAQIIDERGTVLRLAYSDPFSLRRYAHGACVTIQQSTFVRAAAFRAVGGFNTDNTVSWDGELLVDLGLRGARFSRENRVWSGYRVHADSNTSSKRLADRMTAQHAVLFNKIRGRRATPSDLIPAACARLERYLLNPRDVLQRIRYGPVSGRHAGTATPQRIA